MESANVTASALTTRSADGLMKDSPVSKCAQVWGIIIEAWRALM